MKIELMYLHYMGHIYISYIPIELMLEEQVS